MVPHGKKLQSQLGEPDPSAHSRWKLRPPTRPVSLGTCREIHQIFPWKGSIIQNGRLWYMMNCGILSEWYMIYDIYSEWYMIYDEWWELWSWILLVDTVRLSRMAKNMGRSEESLRIWWLNMMIGYSGWGPTYTGFLGHNLTQPIFVMIDLISFLFRDIIL